MFLLVVNYQLINKQAFKLKVKHYRENKNSSQENLEHKPYVFGQIMITL